MYSRWLFCSKWNTTCMHIVCVQISWLVLQSYDPGVLVVLECVFGFNLSIPLNYLLDTFGGKVLVIQVSWNKTVPFTELFSSTKWQLLAFFLNMQGMKDPLTKSNLKLSLLKEHCSSIIMIRELDAGEDSDTSNTNLQKRKKKIVSTCIDFGLRKK